MYPPVSFTVSTDNRHHIQIRIIQGGILYKETNYRGVGGVKEAPRECVSGDVVVTTPGPNRMFLEPGRRRVI